MTDSSYLPNWISPPGDTIKDILNEKKISLTEFANEMGYSFKYTESLIEGNKSITHEIAKKLVAILGGSESFWINREFHYQTDSKRVQNRIKEIKNWLKKFPIKDMLKYGWDKI